MCSVAPGSTSFACRYEVTVDGVEGGAVFQLKVPQEDTRTAPQSATWSVTYDPARPVQDTLTTVVVTDGARAAMVGCTVLVLLLCAVYYVFNYAYRDNGDWQNVSGVLEGASLAQGLVGR